VTIREFEGMAVADREKLETALAATLSAIEQLVADTPDDEEVPIGEWMGDLGDKLGMPEMMDRDTVMAAGEVRRRSHEGLAELGRVAYDPQQVVEGERRRE
jgi:hypothetical protein